MGFEFNLMENDTEKSYLDLIEEFDEIDLIGEDPEEIIVNGK